MKKILSKKLLFFSILLFGIFGLSGNSLAAITFGNTGNTGLWECDFGNSPEWTADISHTTPPGGYGIGVSNNNGTAAGHWSQITSSAGRQNMGWRQWMGSGASGINDNSAGVKAFFSAQSEIWFRMYVRFQSGITWVTGGNQPYFKKMMYVNQGRSPYYCLDVVSNDAVSITDGHVHKSAEPGMGYLTKFSDWGWHSMEFYINRSGGIYRVWIDETLVLEVIGDSSITIDIDNLDFLNNQRVITNASDVYIDLDDLAIAIPAYTGFKLDSHGYRMIGNVSTATPDTTPPAAPTGVIII